MKLNDGYKIKNHLVFTNHYADLFVILKLSSEENDQYKVDLVDMQKLKDKNDGVHFLLIIIDIFSRFMWGEPLENKLKDKVINAFQCTFQRAKKSRHLRTDRGGEFTEE